MEKTFPAPLSIPCKHGQNSLFESGNDTASEFLSTLANERVSGGEWRGVEWAKRVAWLEN